ncbi:ABC transporter substrate-binding protein [Rhizobium leguminosarum bv. trifolii CB782]|nr:ABC transporter substrate-binding protein [Rhizobium leguminosarum bv. trifolii CB782]
MSPEERQLLTALFDRVRTAAAQPRDRDAEALIDQATREQPSATYYLAQAVIVQEKGLEAAANHIKELEEHVRQLEAGASDHRQAEQGGGFLSSIFGNTQTQQPAPVPSNPGPWGQQSRSYEDSRGYDRDGRQQQQPTGPWNQQAGAPSAGGSFLRGALGTAAGVAGGMLLANSLSGIFGNHMSSLGWGSPFGANPFGNASAPTEETIINNYYGNDDARQASDIAGNDNDDNVQQADYDDGDDYSDDSSGDVTDV